MRGPVPALVCAAIVMASPAAAQQTPEPQAGLSLSGDARMGVVYDRPPAWAQRESGLRMTSRARLQFRFRGETDGGLRFGGEFRLDADQNRLRDGRITIGD